MLVCLKKTFRQFLNPKSSVDDFATVWTNSCLDSKKKLERWGGRFDPCIVSKVYVTLKHPPGITETKSDIQYELCKTKVMFRRFRSHK